MLAGLLGAALSGAAALIAPDTYLVTGETTPNRQPDGNSIIIRAPSGLIVFDTGRHKEHAQQILDFARTQEQPVAAVINSHWHLDHIGGNPQLRAAFPGIHVYASNALDAARSGFLADYRAQLQAEIPREAGNPKAQESMGVEMALIDQGEALGPTDIVASSARMTIAGRPLQVHLETRAVTAGDVWVFDPKTRVLLAGDLVTLPAPFFESACPARWRASLGTLENVRFDWLIPGHGTPMHRREFAAYRRAFGNLADCASGTATKNACIDGWIKDASALIESKDVSYARTLIDYYLENYLRHPSERISKFCAS